MGKGSRKNGTRLELKLDVVSESGLSEMGASPLGDQDWEDQFRRSKLHTRELDLVVAHFQYRVDLIQRPPSSFHTPTGYVSKFHLTIGDYIKHYSDAMRWVFEDFEDAPYSLSWSLDMLNPVWESELTQQDIMRALEPWHVPPDQEQLFEV
jgi:hypothetical protein